MSSGALIEPLLAADLIRLGAVVFVGRAADRRGGDAGSAALEALIARVIVAAR